MRYWLLPIFVACFAVNLAAGQDIKKKKKDEPPRTITDFGGKTFVQWKKELHSSDPAEREVAFSSIINFPLAEVYTALPDILKELEKDKYVKVDLSVCVNGVTTIGKIIQAKRAPTPEMIELMKDIQKDMQNAKAKESLKRKQEAFMVLMKKNGPDPKLVERAVALFRHFLRSEQVMLKVRTVQALPVLGPGARKALPEVKLVCSSPISWEVRKEGLLTLGHLSVNEKGQPDEKLIVDFVKRLDDGSAQVRVTAVSTLGQFGHALEKDRVFILAKLARPAEYDSDHRVRIAAHLAIMNANGKPSATHLGAIAKFSQDSDPRVRLASLQGLLAFGEEGKKALPTIVATLTGSIADPQADVSQAALNGLVHLKVYNVVAKSLENPEPPIRLASIHALLAVGDDIKKALPSFVASLMTMVEDPAPEVAGAALSGLIGLRAYDSTKDLEKLRKKYEVSNPVLSKHIEGAIENMHLIAKHEKLMKDKGGKEKNGIR